jgi:hypothetical protein
VFEADGLPTVIIAARPFAVRLENMSVPRLLITPHPMGRVLGAPGDTEKQRRVVEAALDLLEEACEKSVRLMEGAYP